MSFASEITRPIQTFHYHHHFTKYHSFLIFSLKSYALLTHNVFTSLLQSSVLDLSLETYFASANAFNASHMIHLPTTNINRLYLTSYRVYSPVIHPPRFSVYH